MGQFQGLPGVGGPMNEFPAVLLFFLEQGFFLGSEDHARRPPCEFAYEDLTGWQ